MADLVRYIADGIRFSIGFQAECQWCRHARTLDLRVLAEMIGPEKSIAFLRKRLRCGQCNGRPTRIELHPIRNPVVGGIEGAFGGAYHDANEIPSRLEALSGPLRRGPSGKIRR